MRRPFRWDKKYLYWGITAFCVVAAAILFYMALNYIGAVGSAISALFEDPQPIYLGSCDKLSARAARAYA